METNNYTCKDCIIPESQWRVGAKKLLSSPLCPSPVTEECKTSLANAVLVTLKLRSMLQNSLSYLGSAISGKIISLKRVTNVKVYSKMVGTEVLADLSNLVIYEEPILNIFL